MSETYERMLERKRKADALPPAMREKYRKVYDGLLDWLLADCAAQHRLPVELCRIDARHRELLVELFSLVEMIGAQPEDKGLYRAFYEKLEQLAGELWMELAPEEAREVQEVFEL